MLLKNSSSSSWSASNTYGNNNSTNQDDHVSRSPDNRRVSELSLRANATYE